MERATAMPIINELIRLKQLHPLVTRAQPFGAEMSKKAMPKYLGWPSSYRLIGIPFGQNPDVLRVLVSVHLPPKESGENARHEHHVIMGIVHPDYSGKGVGDEPPPYFLIRGKTFGNDIRTSVSNIDLNDALLHAQTRLHSRRSYHVLDYKGHVEETNRFGMHHELQHSINHGRAEVQMAGLIDPLPVNSPGKPAARMTQWQSFRLAYHELPGMRHLVPVLVGVYRQSGKPSDLGYQPLGVIARSETNLEPGKEWRSNRCPYFHPFVGADAKKRFIELYRGANYWGFHQLFGKNPNP